MNSIPKHIPPIHATDLCVQGLVTDGGHHKQWYLEQLLLRLVGKDEWDELKRIYDWDKGIAP